MGLADALGVFDSLELRSVDWRYAAGRKAAEPMSDEVRLVGIDDASLDSIGRWPWPRATLALVVEELVRAGARTVALDLLLTESEAAESAEPDAVSPDVRLADALRGTRGVLGIHLEENDGLDAIWQTPAGAKSLGSLLTLLGQEIDVDPDNAAQRVGLAPELRERFLARPLEFKAMAAWMRARELAQAGRLGTLDEFVAECMGGRSLASFDALGPVQRAWARARAWERLQHLHRSAPPGGTHRDAPPVSVLAEAASGAGVVTSDAYDIDGAKRRTRPLWVSPSGEALQFGLAAAATHMGLPPDAVLIEGDRIRIGEARIPLQDGRFVLDWPTTTFAGFPALASESNSAERVAISIARLVSLGRERARLAAFEREASESLRTLAVKAGADPARLATPDGQAGVKQAIEDWSFDLNPSDPAQAADARAAERLMQVSAWANEGRGVIDAASAEVREAVQDRLVFVGWTATGALADQVQTPYGPRTPGVFVHAVVADMAIARHARRDATAWDSALAISTLTLLCALAAARLGGWWSFLMVAAMLAGYFWAAGLLAFESMRTVYPLVAPISAGAASWVAGTAALAVIAARERSRVTRQFAARVAPQLVERLAQDPDSLSMAGSSREITTLFGDLAGFTAIAERLGGPEVVATLNRYMSRLTDELVKREAYVNKFLGDGIMAFWSAFGDDEFQERRACEAAVACQQAVEELGAAIGGDGPRISLRLGIATGHAVVGDCGAPPKLNDYTAIGDAVNLAARLESANKQFGTRILIDAQTASGLAGTSIRTRTLGQVTVVGQSRPVEVLAVVDSAVTEEDLALSAEAVAHFAARRFPESQASWRLHVERFGASKISETFLTAIAEGIGVADGVLHLRAK